MNTARSAQADGKLIPDIFLMHDIPQWGSDIHQSK
jgi:hypothetical protein